MTSLARKGRRALLFGFFLTLGAVLTNLCLLPSAPSEERREAGVTIGPDITVAVVQSARGGQAEAAETRERPGNRIVKIEAGRRGGAPWVRVVTTGRVAYTERYLPNPDRLLLVLKNTNLPRIALPGPGQAAPLLRVRAAQHDRDTWIVLDLAAQHRWKIQPMANGLVLVPAGAPVAPPRASRPALRTAADAGRGADGLLVAAPVVGASYQVVDVSAENLGDKTRMTVTTDGLARYRVRSERQGRFLVLQIFGAGLSGQLSVPGLPTGVIEKVAIRQTSEDSEPVVEVAAQLGQATPYLVFREQNQIMVEFTNPGRAGVVGVRGNLNALISVDFENADLESVLRALAQQAGFDLVMTPTSQNKSGSAVTVSIHDQALKSVLDYILRPLGMSYAQSGNTLRVGLASEFPMETLVFTLRNADAKNTTLKSSLESSFTEGSKGKVVVDENANRVIVSAIPGDMARVKEIIADIDTQRRLVTRNFRLQYSQTRKLLPLVQPQVSSLGSIRASETENMLVVTDIPGNVDDIGRLIRSLDVKAQQVMIEARIVEISLSNEQELGVRWNTRMNDPASNPQLNISSQPAAIGSVGMISVGSLQGGVDINATLSLLESKGRANTISNPRIATLNNQTATIQASQNIPYRTSNVSNGVVSNVVQYLELPITLHVTPQSTHGQVMLNPLTLTVATVVGDQVPPATTTRSASTQMLVSDGETIAIGGLVRDEERTRASQVPLLGDIPLLGYLFKSTTVVKSKVELVVFLTPHILK